MIDIDERPLTSDAVGRPTRRSVLASLALCVATLGVARGDADEPWTVLPPTPDLPPASRSATLEINGTRIFFAEFGSGTPVVLLHGGMANANYWGHQIAHLAQRFRVIAMDTRGHGRSPLLSDVLAYDLFADDVIALLDSLDIRRAAIVGWSDGAITGLELAIRHPARVSRLFAFAGNVWRNAMRRPPEDSTTFPTYVARCKDEYAVLSPSPAKYPDFMRALHVMWRGQGEIPRSRLAHIRAPTLIADGDHDEIIKPIHITEVADMIPGARALALKATSHFAMLQDPDGFNRVLDRFLA